MLTPQEREALNKEWAAINRELDRLPTEAADPQADDHASRSAAPMLQRLDEIEYLLGEHYLAERRKSEKND